MATSYIQQSIIRTVFYRTCRRSTRRSNLFTVSSRALKSASTTTPPAEQAPQSTPESSVDDYYALLLEQPLLTTTLQQRSVSSSTDSSQSSTSSTKPNQPDTKLEKARIIFGSKLAGPGMRQKYVEDLPSLQALGQGTYIAGVWIPPKPTEPDNCCMSGCVNCVWDGYREELEEWVKKRKDAHQLAVSKHEGSAAGAAGKSDEDGAGSIDWSLENAMDDIPIGIREFMKTEKRLQQQRKEARG